MTEQQQLAFVEGACSFAPVDTYVSFTDEIVELGVFRGDRRIALTMDLWPRLWTNEMRRRGNACARRLALRVLLIDNGYESSEAAQAAGKRFAIPFMGRTPTNERPHQSARV